MLACAFGGPLCVLGLVYVLSVIVEHRGRKNIKDKVVLITGATSGVGRGMSKYYKYLFLTLVIQCFTTGVTKAVVCI